jgi:hypothetical protein
MPEPSCLKHMDLAPVQFIGMFLYCFFRYRRDEDGDETSDSLKQVANFTVGESSCSSVNT